MAKVDVVHIPYKGGAHAVTDLAAGRLSFIIESVPVAISMLKGGKVKGIAISTVERVSVLPDLPPIAETLSGYNLTNWLGILAPAGTPPDVVARLNVELVAILKSPEMRARMAARGADPIGDLPDEFAAHIRREITRLGPMVRALRARVD
jgi:tripartite-type tricarboxylate transporter receptor subunit TctC